MQAAEAIEKNFRGAQVALHETRRPASRCAPGGREKEFGREMEKGILCMDGWAGRIEKRCVIVKETPKRLLIRLEEDCVMRGGRWKRKGEEVYVPKYAIRRELAPSMELAR
jgi:hypothetical protein